MKLFFAFLLMVCGGILIDASVRRREAPLQLGHRLTLSPLQASVGGRLAGLLLLTIGFMLLLN